MLEVVPFRSEFEARVVDLIVGIQRGEFGLPISADQQPDLRQIAGYYQVRNGNFWVALSGSQVVGTISLLDIGAGQGALRKMFVAPGFRGRDAGTAARLLETLIAWCAARGVREVFLGTTPFFHAAHRFYEKNGFHEVEPSSLPAAFPIMEVDTKFYRREVLLGVRPESSTGSVLRLSDGRELGYAQYGDASGSPLLLFQGTPTSRLPHNPLGSSAPVRLVVAERPGFGRSDFLPGRRLLDWPRDVRELADHLGLERFSVAGVSGGAPHALACGVALPDRVRRIGVVSGIGPLEAAGSTSGMAAQRKAGAWLARRAPVLLRPIFWAFRNPARNPERFVERFTEGFSEADRALLADPALRSLRARSYAEATRRGVRGFAYEVALLSRPWGFSLSEVPCEVLLWHGESDASTPVAMARHVEKSLPRCRGRYFPGEGHFVAARHWDEIVRALTADSL